MARLISAFLLALAALSAVLWVQSHIWGVGIGRRTTVESGSVIKATDPAEELTEYISHTRHVSSHLGRFEFVYMRADELNKATGLPRRVTWHARAGRGGGRDRFDAPEWIAWTGFDWRFRRAEAGRPNGEYWSNRDIFLCVPYWALVLITGTGGWLVGRRSRIVRRRMRRGLCLACGYDVRASPDRCPECGRAPGAGQRAAPASASA